MNDETYTNVYTTVPVAVGDGFTPIAVAGTLVHSKYIQLERYGSPALPFDLQAAAFPNRKRRQVVRAVRGQVIVRMRAGWDDVSYMAYGFRVAKFLQDPTDAGIIVPGTYGMFSTLESTQGPYVSADIRFLTEQRHYQSQNAIAQIPTFHHTINWSGREVLDNEECLAFYFENARYSYDIGATTAQVDVVLWLRTLCEVMPG